MHLLPMLNAYKLDQPVESVGKQKNKQKKIKQKEEVSDQETMEVNV